jgi:hypothetical protein
MESLYPPQVEDGQVLGAATLNAYANAVRWLLGRAHETRQAQRAYGYLAYGSLDELCRGWLYLTTSRKISFVFNVTTQYAGDSWDIRLHLMRDVSGTPTFVEVWGTTGSGNTTVSQTVTVSSDFTAEAITRFRFVGMITSGSGWVSISVRQVATYYDFTISPPTFTNGAVSSASQLNALRSGIYDLIRYLPPFNALSYTTNGEITVDRVYGGQEWYDVPGNFYWPYRPDAVIVGFLVRDTLAGWQWRALLKRSDGSESVIYTSPSMPEVWGWSGVEETIDLSSLGISYFELVSLRIQVSPPAPPNPGDHRYLTHRRPYVFRLSSQNPGASWPTIPSWSYGDTTVGATQLNALSTALTQLSGTGHNGILYDGDACYEDTRGLLGEIVYYGLRNKPILMYLPKPDGNPRLRFGTTLVRDTIYSLPGGSDWMAFDLRQCEALAPGQIYIVEDVLAAAEAERVLSVAEWS